MDSKKNNILYFDTAGGAAGDMLLASLANMDEEYKNKLEDIFKILLENLDGVQTSVSEIEVQGIRSHYVDVRMVCEHNHKHHEHHNHEHHNHEHHNHEHAHSHEHRNLANIIEFINNTPINDKAKNDAIEIFKIIAEAEAYVHRKNIDDVHFHEVGAYDSIVDIVSFCVLVDYISPEKIMSTPLPMGIGNIECAHGTMPNPAPATIEILKGIPVYQTSIRGEMITPTAAAILKHFVSEYTYSFDAVIKSIGNGAGGRRYEGSSCICRAVLLEPQKQNTSASAQSDKNDNSDDKTHDEKHYVLEANIDDMTGESLSYVQTLLMNNGASDCWFSPIIMKKSRPANTLHVLSTKGRKDSLIKMILRQTTTLGIRITEVEKVTSVREIVKLETEYGVISYKVKYIEEGKVHVKPEYEEVQNIAMKRGLSITILMQELTNFYYKNCDKSKI